MSVRDAPGFEIASEVSSIASDRTLSRHERIEFQQFGNAQNTFDMLQGSDSSGGSHVSFDSNISRYEDAPSSNEALDDAQSIEHLRQHLMSPTSSTSQGLVAITPIKSPSRPSRQGFAGAYAQSPLTPEFAATSSYAISPHTPRLRKGVRSSGAPQPQLPPLARPPVVPQPHVAPLPPEIEEERAHPSKIKHTPTGQFQVAFGKPRVASDSRSLQSQGSHVSDEGNIEPSRQVSEHPWSYLRRSRQSHGQQGPYLAGLPRLPTFPLPSATPNSDFEREKRDLWGRREAPPPVAWTILCVCALFPPFWLLMCFGYFDSVYGVFPRPVKLTAMFLGLLVFAAVVALVVIFSIIKP